MKATGLLAMVAALLCISSVWLVASCGSTTPPLGDGVGTGTGGSCITPNDGCPCTNPGEVVDCGKVISNNGGSITCALGSRTCNAGTWSSCDTSGSTQSKSIQSSASLSLTPSSLSPLSLGLPQGCSSLPAGTDGGSAEGGGGTGLPLPPTACVGPSGSGNCTCTVGSCNESCGGGCAFGCSPGASCNNHCTGGGCNFECSGGSTCTNQCSGGGCTFDCPSGSTCSNTCSGGGCTFNCASGNCTNVCSGGGCTTNTSDAGAGVNPCDPYCNAQVDTGLGLDAGAGLTTTDAGALTLATNPEAGACQTIVKGIVKDPAGNVPLPNIYVFAKTDSNPLPALPPLSGCDTCQKLIIGGGDAGAPDLLATTDIHGTFFLFPFPAGVTQIIVQTGRWRKLVTLPPLTMCGVNDIGTVNLPGDPSQGDMPKLAIATGSADPFECLLAKIGINETQFRGDGTGVVDYFKENGTGLQGGAPYNGPAPSPAVMEGTLANWQKYSAVILPCIGGEDPRTAPQLQNLHDYAEGGGRIFATHYESDWLNTVNPPASYKNTATAWPTAPSPNNGTGTIQTGFAQGLTLFNWLKANAPGGTFAGNNINLTSPRDRVTAPTTPAQNWIEDTGGGYMHAFSFDTPWVAGGADGTCGKVVFAGFHVVSGGGIAGGAGATFPGECNIGAAMDGQQETLEYMLFSLTACAGPPPIPPPPPYTGPAIFTRVYQASCPAGADPVWRQFGFGSVTGSDSKIKFSAQTASTAALLSSATSYPFYTASGATINPYGPYPPDPAASPAGGVDLVGIFPTNGSQQYLQVTIELDPSTDLYTAPILTAWRQLYDCVPSE